MKNNFLKAQSHMRTKYNTCNNLSNNDLSDNDINLSDFIEFSSCEGTSENKSESYCKSPKYKGKHFDEKIDKCEDNINYKKNVEETKLKLYDSKICQFDQLDIIARKLEKIVESLKTISHLIQYYLRMLEQVKIEVSQSDISHSVGSCIETTVSLASYIKANIEANKTFVTDDKHNNRDGYYLTNGITKIYYIEKVKLSLLKNGELVVAVYEEKRGMKEYELGGDYSCVGFEGDLYSLIDIAKEKAIHFNKYIQRKHMKASSIFNLHLIYLNKYK